MAKDDFIKTGDVLTRIIAHGPNLDVLKYIVTKNFPRKPTALAV